MFIVPSQMSMESEDIFLQTYLSGKPYPPYSIIQTPFFNFVVTSNEVEPAEKNRALNHPAPLR